MGRIFLQVEAPKEFKVKVATKALSQGRNISTFIRLILEAYLAAPDIERKVERYIQNRLEVIANGNLS